MSWKDEPVKSVVYKKSDVTPFEYNKHINYLEKIKISTFTSSAIEKGKNVFESPLLSRNNYMKSRSALNKYENNQEIVINLV